MLVNEILIGDQIWKYFTLLRTFVMGNTQKVMPKVNFEENENLKTAHSYSKYVEAKNYERAILAERKLKSNRRLCAVIFATVLSIYGYTILKVKQEDFLDDFEEPPRIIKDD